MKVKRLFLRVVFLLFFVGSTGFSSGSETLWFRLEKFFTYRDIDRFCSSYELPPSVVFEVEFTNGVLRAAVLKMNTIDPFSTKLVFTPGELAAVQFVSDSFNRKWIKSIKLNARQINWLFFQPFQVEGCTPTQKLLTLDPNQFVYSFDLTQSAANPMEFSSGVGTFSGQRVDGRLYQASLYLVQKRVFQP